MWFFKTKRLYILSGSIVLCLFLAAVLSLKSIDKNQPVSFSHPIVTVSPTLSIKSSLTIILKTTATEIQAQSLISEIRAMKGVKEVKYTSQEQTFNQFKEENKDNKVMLEVIAPNIFYASIEVYLFDISLTDKLIGDVKRKSYVEQVLY